jgi:hypothetical protein
MSQNWWQQSRMVSGPDMAAGAVISVAMAATMLEAGPLSLLACLGSLLLLSLWLLWPGTLQGCDTPTGRTVTTPSAGKPPAAGELSFQGHLNAVVPSPLVHVTEQLSGRHLLVDIGAAFSIFPHQSAAAPSGPLLSRPSGKNIS